MILIYKNIKHIYFKYNDYNTYTSIPVKDTYFKSFH